MSKIRTLETLEINEIQILEIIRSNTQSSTHKLAILNRLKQLAVHGGKDFDIKIMQNLINGLTNEGFIEFIEKVESYKLTDLGKEVLFS
ncbi:MAG: hypothetical protein HeimC3_25420 [Candidatus Heimdallarchaeota archaeon LC_3]|nr:MAG: hypothetical protein HeimC3_25420 [Candidatus Heimdallarchaeota archaeon LC_3]